jgi:NADH-quinone oxidoreductase subunit M
MRASLSALALGSLALVVLLAALPARAAPSSHGGRLVLSLPGGAPGPLVLAPGLGGWVGTITVTNVGAEPLTVSRVAIRGDEDDVRSPAHLSARFVDGPSATATLPAGASKDLVVAWMPDKDPRVRQAFGHVVVTSTDEQAGEVAMGLRAQLPTGLGWVGEHVLSILVGCPLLIVLAAAAARLAGRPEDRLVRGVAIGVGVVEALLALWMYGRFAPELGRADGNDGFQFVERAVWVRSMAVEWYVGVDGTSVALVLLAAISVLVASVIARPEKLAGGYYAALGLLASGLVAGLVALDLTLLFLAWQVVLLALVVLIGGWGDARGGELAAAKTAAYGALGSAAMLAAFVALSRASGRTFLVDGSAAAHTMSIPELARTSFAAKAPILGVPFVAAVWGLLFVAVAIAAPVVPLHGWLPDALEQAPPGAAVAIGGAVVSFGPYLLLRVGLGAMPEGARWAGASVAALGGVGAVYGALCAMAQRDLRRFAGYATVASAGTCLYGLGSLTPQGVAACVAGLFAHGLGALLLLGVAASLQRRVGTCDVTRVRGLGQAPVLAGLLGAGLGITVGAPGLAGFWGVLLALLGGFAPHPVLGVVLAAALVVVVAAHLRVARALLLARSGSADAAGALHDATPREIAALVPIAALGLLLGLWPVPLLAEIGAGARDASAAVDPTGPDPPLR